MSEQKTHLTSTWQLVKAYWQSEEKVSAYLYLIAVVLLTIFLVALTLVNTIWIKYFWNALQQYNGHMIVKLLLLFCVLAAVLIFAGVYRYYLSSVFVLRWRQWMTKTLTRHWLQPQHYYYLENFDGHMPDNPDQRIQEDIDLFTTNTTALATGVIDAVTTLIIFSATLWVISGPIKIPLGSLGSFTIHGYLFWIALVYSIGGTYLTHLIGRPLIKLNFLKQKKEADFRFRAVRVRNNAENIALYHSENSETNSLLDNFKHVVSITFDVIKRQKILLYFTIGFNQISSIIPLCAALPMYFAKKIGIGGIQQIMMLFGNVQNAFSFIVTSYSTIAAWRATCQRLIGFSERLEKVQHLKDENWQVDIQQHDQSFIGGERLSINTQQGKHLFENLDIKFEQGKHCLLTGPSGLGKTTLIRTIAGIWPFAHGTVKLPASQRIMYIPQRVYLPLGTLKEAILYPGDESITDDAITELLKDVGLETLVKDLDVRKNWSDALSIGEQQKIAFVRIILQKPDWVFLDESTSSLDLQSEARLYHLLKEKLPHCTIVSVGHRASVKDFHDVELNLAMA